MKQILAAFLTLASLPGAHAQVTRQDKPYKEGKRDIPVLLSYLMESAWLNDS
jgi:hypothetical protein